MRLGFLFVTLFFLVSEAMATPIPPNVKKVVTFIFLSDAEGKLLRDQKTGNPVPNGTGFFVTATTSDVPKRIFGYLVTAKHVLKDQNGNPFTKVYLRVNKFDDSSEFVPLSLVHEGSKRNVFIHSDPTVDIAVIPIPEPSASIYDYRTVPADTVTTRASFEALQIGEGTDVFFAGLFLPHYGESRNVPIVRFGKVAMVTDDRILWKADVTKPPQPTQLYLLETQSYGGNSGSPVFFYLGADRTPGTITIGQPTIVLAGVMSGRFNDWQPIQTIPTANSIPISWENNGIAAVAPAYLLHEILFSEELKKFHGVRTDLSIKQPQ